MNKLSLLREQLESTIPKIRNAAAIELMDSGNPAEDDTCKDIIAHLRADSAFQEHCELADELEEILWGANA